MVPPLLLFKELQNIRTGRLRTPSAIANPIIDLNINREPLEIIKNSKEGHAWLSLGKISNIKEVQTKLPGEKKATRGM